MNTRCAVLVLLVLVQTVISEDPTVDTPLGRIKGLEITDKGSGENVYQFRGIRYGKPPSGERRFRKPEPVDKWDDVYDATTFGYACPQVPLPFLDDGSSNQSEDCLFLNVYIPRSLKDKQMLSVMVWIHGGGFVLGNGHIFDGTTLALEGNVVVVTINYRLGFLGFLGLFHPASIGNYGLWDQHMALQWVHDNIAAFRGDPGSVTIFGESAGGFSVSYQSVFPSNEGLFHRGIAQSGTLSRHLMLRKDSALRGVKRYAERLNCPSDDMNKYVDCLRKVSVEEILNATNMFQDMPVDKFSVESYFGPAIDGDMFPSHPMVLLNDPQSAQSRFFRSLDFMAGATSQEGSMVYMMTSPQLQENLGFNISISIPADALCRGMIKPFVEQNYGSREDLVDSMCTFYTSDGTEDEQSIRAADFYGDLVFYAGIAEILNVHSQNSDGRTYQYQVSRQSPKPFGPPAPSWFKGVGHGDELLYLFHRDKGDNPELLDVNFTDSDRNFARTLISFWTTFAKSGIPDAGETAMPWLEYDGRKKIFIDLGNELSLRQNMKSKGVKYWTEEIPSPDYSADRVAPHDEL